MITTSLLIIYLFIVLAIAILYWNTRSYFRRVTSNVFSRWDYQQVLFVFLLGAFLLLGPLLNFPLVRSPKIALTILLILLGSAFLGAELFRQFRNVYMRPASALYRPFLVRYWPAWILINKQMAIGETALIEFHLITSEFDFDLVLLSDPGSLQPGKDYRKIPASKLDTKQKKELLQSRHMVYPFSQYEEKAITESGYFLSETTLRLVCKAPDFEPSFQEIKTNIETLSRRRITFPLVPKGAGKKHIIFELLDSNGLVKGSIKVSCEVASHSRKIVGIASKIVIVLTTLLGLIGSGLLAVEKIKLLFGL